LNQNCDVCHRKYDVKLRLKDGQPCYDLTQDRHAHSLVYHWYIVWEFDNNLPGIVKNGKEGDLFPNTYYSLVTNTRADVVAKIKGLMAAGKDIVLYCMFQCRGAKFTKSKAKAHRCEMID